MRILYGVQGAGQMEQLSNAEALGQAGYATDLDACHLDYPPTMRGFWKPSTTSDIDSLQCKIGSKNDP